jgi:hypothetical protein
MRRFLLILIAFALTACSVGQQGELDQNRLKWDSQGIDRYRFLLFVSCFCAFTERMPLSIEVRYGEIVSMAYNDGTPVPADDPEMAFFSQFATIDRLFDELKTGDTAGGDSVKITYDPTYGFPTQVDADPIKDAVDDEFYLTLSDFEPIK